MSAAFRCDNCGEFYEGSSEDGVEIVLGNFEVTLSVKKRKPPIADSAHEVEEDENKEEVLRGVRFLDWNVFGNPFSLTNHRADLCRTCLNHFARSALMSEELS